MMFTNYLLENSEDILRNIKFKEDLRKGGFNVEANEYFGMRRMDKIKFKDDKDNLIELSIQGSNTSYCSPRETLTNFNDYESLEVAFILNGAMVTFEDIFNNGEQEFLNKLLQQYFDGDCIYAYVDVNVIEQVFSLFKSEFEIQ